MLRDILAILNDILGPMISTQRKVLIWDTSFQIVIWLWRKLLINNYNRPIVGVSSNITQVFEQSLARSPRLKIWEQLLNDSILWFISYHLRNISCSVSMDVMNPPHLHCRFLQLGSGLTDNMTKVQEFLDYYEAHFLTDITFGAKYLFYCRVPITTFFLLCFCFFKAPSPVKLRTKF